MRKILLYALTVYKKLPGQSVTSAAIKTYSILIAMVLLYLPCLCHAGKSITIATLEWEPYIGTRLENQGFMAQITRIAFKSQGYDVQYVFLPWKRAVVMAEAGIYDGYFPAYWARRRLKKSIFTDAIIAGTIGFFKKKSDTIVFTDLKDLKPYRIGVVRGYINTVEFDAADYLTKEEAVSDLQNLQKLAGNRVDLIVCDRFVEQYLVKHYLPDLASRIEFMKPALQVKNLYICISKKAENAQKKVAVFNKGLQQIKKQGIFNKIAHRYGFGEPVSHPWSHKESR